MMITKSLYSDTSERRHDVDWLRVILFGLLIWFHFVVFYPYQPEGLFAIPYYFIVSVMHQWRLAALFVISGMGTAFALRRRTWQQYVSERGTRLGIPLLFTVYILFFGIFEFTEKTTLLFTIFPGSEDMPYGHLWFVYNLLIYSIILTPFFFHVKANPEGFIMRLVRSIMNVRAGLGILILPPIILSLNAILFKPWAFGEVGMWWEFPRYMLYFLFGFLMISVRDEYFAALDKIRIPLTILTPILAVLWFIISLTSGIPNVMEGGWVDEGYRPFSVTATMASILQSFHAWSWCLLIFTWSSKLLNEPNKYLAYLNESVYPTYIVHLHITFPMIAILSILGIGFFPAMIFATPILIITVLACFEIVRRASLFRPVFGIKGGQEEVNLLFPFNSTKERPLSVIFTLMSHGMALGMVIVLMLSLALMGG